MTPPILPLACILLLLAQYSHAADIPQWKDLFNGKDLSGWVNVNTDKDTFTGNLEPNIRTTQKTRHVRLAEKVSRGMAVVASSEGGEIFATPNLCVVGHGRCDGHGPFYPRPRPCAWRQPVEASRLGSAR